VSHVKPWHVEPRGRFERQTVRSRVLEGNPLGDPAERPLWVYLPPGVGDDPARRHPSIYVIQGYTGQVDMWWNRSALRPTVPELVDELFAGPDLAPPAVVAFVDCWTSLGGSQFLNSPATGRYLDYLCDEVVAFVDGRYPTLPAREHRGIAGKSSGGYGAMVAPMLRVDVFGALASHAGDALFEHCYLPDMAKATRALRDQVWARWLALDPVRMAAGHAAQLRSLRGIYLDAGRRDQFWLDLGAAAFSAELDALGIDHTFELFDATHSGIEYRYPRGLAFLAERLGS
jgi:S-formylglutathione hydrolase FrmB